MSLKMVTITSGRIAIKKDDGKDYAVVMSNFVESSMEAAKKAVSKKEVEKATSEELVLIKERNKDADIESPELIAQVKERMKGRLIGEKAREFGKERFDSIVASVTEIVEKGLRGYELWQ